MDMSELSLFFEPPLARLRLARPERRNAMTLAMWRALPELCAEVGRREDARVVVVEGAGGIMTDWAGAPLTAKSDGRVLAVGNAALHARLLALI